MVPKVPHCAIVFSRPPIRSRCMSETRASESQNGNATGFVVLTSRRCLKGIAAQYTLGVEILRRISTDRAFDRYRLRVMPAQGRNRAIPAPFTSQFCSFCGTDHAI